MRYIVSADDYGLSRGITDNILDAVDHGAVTSVGVIANGDAFDYAMEELRRRPALRLALHLNVVEGRPLCPPEEVALLVDADGRFRHSFQSLWALHLRSGAGARAALAAQLQREMRAQIDRVRDGAGRDRPLCVDSHLHVHMLPFAFDALLGLHDELRFRYVRLLSEPFLRVRRGPRALRNYLGPNLLKHLLLNALSRRARRELAARGIAHCRNFVGVLFTSNMSEHVVDAALARLGPRAGGEDVVEFLFHPGGAAPGEESLWRHDPHGYGRAYFSPWRGRERESLKAGALRALLAAHEPVR